MSPVDVGVGVVGVAVVGALARGNCGDSAADAAANTGSSTGRNLAGSSTYLKIIANILLKIHEQRVL